MKIKILIINIFFTINLYSQVNSFELKITNCSLDKKTINFNIDRMIYSTDSLLKVNGIEDAVLVYHMCLYYNNSPSKRWLKLLKKYNNQLKKKVGKENVIIHSPIQINDKVFTKYTHIGIGPVIEKING